MTIVSIYRNKWNKNKFIEVHNDGWRHNTVRQFMLFEDAVVQNLMGDKYLHRVKAALLKEMLEDYERYGECIIERRCSHEG